MLISISVLSDEEVAGVGGYMKRINMELDCNLAET